MVTEFGALIFHTYYLSIVQNNCDGKSCDEKLLGTYLTLFYDRYLCKYELVT